VVNEQLKITDFSSHIQIPDWGDAIGKLSNRIHTDLDNIKKDISSKQSISDSKIINEKLS